MAFKWRACKRFFHESYTLIDLFFIFIYFFEQLSLIVILSRTDFSPQIIVGIFSIVVVTTASFQNRAYESRLNSISETVVDQNNIIYEVTGDYRKVVNENRKLNESLKKSKRFIDMLFGELKKSQEEIDKLKKKR